MISIISCDVPLYPNPNAREDEGKDSDVQNISANKANEVLL